ncbi:MAG: PadR family transcriptional regulator [Acidimicrobiia bacterium]
MSRRPDDLLLGEWACLGLLFLEPSHGFAIAARLKPDGDIGRVWSLSRPLTYRALEQLEQRGLIAAVGEERGIAGGNRTIYAPTRAGRARIRKWMKEPVAHSRDLRSELLLKLLIAEMADIDVSSMLDAQSDVIAAVAAAHRAKVPDRGRADVVDLWRAESSEAALRFLERVRR